ncbi:MAG: helix-turn-helix transcriptional regulator [Spirochaetales bacterium]|nr:helix-turn-helix transcriptional regulator [Spirochaetales bacterium]MBR4426289.1 helix-turn-helix transcriptional regulator [Spirochaetales bacterium]
MEIDNILPEEEVTDIADFFKVFGDPTRLKILFLLDAGEANVNSISANLGISPSVASQHLKLLRVARLVRWRKDGKSVIYSLNDEHISRILALGTEHYEETIGPEV